MDQLSFYDKILEVSSPWKTSSVELEESNELVIVTISCDPSYPLACPLCASLCNRYDTRSRRWRHLDTCQYKTIIESSVPRIKCPQHGVKTVLVPWADKVSRYTTKFEISVLEWAKECSVLSLSRRLRMSWTAINGIMYRGVDRGLKRRWEVDCRSLSVDETCIGKGRDFITILSNSKGQVIAISDGRSSESLLKCFNSVPKHFLNRVKTITMDFSPAYKKAVNQRFGVRARKIIAFDHFHVAKLLSRALNHIRKSEILKIPDLDRRYHHKIRYTWLRNPSNFDDEEAQRLQELRLELINTATAWYFKEKAREIWYSSKSSHSRNAWSRWIALVNKTKLKPLMSAAKTIKDNLVGIINAIKKGVSNARAEALNRKIKDIARRASGYRNRERYKTAVLFHLGQLDMAPESPP